MMNEKMIAHYSDVMLKKGCDILQKIADRGNWLISDEVAAVRDEYNACVGVYMVLDRVLRKTFGCDKVDIKRNGCVWKKTIMDFVRWKIDGEKLAKEYEEFMKIAYLEYVYEDSDKKTLMEGADKIRELNDAVMERMIVTAV